MIHIFDLDLTLWDSFDKRGHPIWAKQMIFPLHFDGANRITDDVGSACTLRDGVRDYLRHLRERGHQVGFISNGRHWNLPDEFQPSIRVLQHFGISDYFNHIRVLNYKTSLKSEVLGGIADPLWFYDDDAKVLADVARLGHVTTINTAAITDWRRELERVK